MNNLFVTNRASRVPSNLRSRAGRGHRTAGSRCIGARGWRRRRSGHNLSLPKALAVAVTAMLIGDTLLFILGRYMGWGLLGLLCRLSVNPESCVLRSAESFYKRGKTTLLIAKFIPGVNTMAPPLAGSMRMPPLQFFRFDSAGASLYILAYGGLGFVFRDFLAAITRGFQAASHVFGEVLFVAAIAYTAYRFWLYHKNKVYRVVPRVQVEELARKLAIGRKGQGSDPRRPQSRLLRRQRGTHQRIHPH